MILEPTASVDGYIIYKCIDCVETQKITLPATGEPIISSVNNATVVAGAGGSFQVSAIGIPNSFMFNLSGEPTGVFIDSSTGLMVISGETATGQHIFTITASNGINPIATQIFTLIEKTAPEIVINLMTINGVTPPVAGAITAKTIIETSQYTGTVVWAPINSLFNYATQYIATITLTQKIGYTLVGVAADNFIVAGAEIVTNEADSGVIVAVFPKTDPIPTPTPIVPGNGGGGGGGGGGGSGVAQGPVTTPSPTQTPNADIENIKDDELAGGVAKTPAPRTVRTPRPTASVLATSGNASAVMQMVDIGDDHWAAIYIYELVGGGIINGYPMLDGSYEFRPSNDITRAELMKLIAVTLGLELIEEYDGSKFMDWGGVEDWAKPYIAALIEKDIVLGSLEGGDLYINANDFINREEMIAMVVRALNVDLTKSVSTGIDPLNGIGDVTNVPDFEKISDWAVAEVTFAIANNMINFDINGNIAPLVNAKRDEAAMLLYILIKYLDL